MITPHHVHYAKLALRPQNAGQRPPTSVVNLIFVLANHAAPLAPTHFGPDEPLTFLDLFFPLPISSRARARAFLWLMHHYLEGPSSTTPNPFADEYARANPGRVPWLHRLEPGAVENVDTKEELQWGRTMSARREEFLKRLMSGGEEKRGGERGSGVGSGAATPTSASVTAPVDRESAWEKEREREKEKENQRGREPRAEDRREREGERLRHRSLLPNGEREKPFLHYVPPTRAEQRAEEERKRGTFRSLYSSILICSFLTPCLLVEQITPHARDAIVTADTTAATA